MTVALDPRTARDTLALFEGSATPEEGARLAALLGSWEEMLAHLLLRRGSLPPDIAAAIHAAHASGGSRSQPAAAHRASPMIGAHARISTGAPCRLASADLSGARCCGSRRPM